MPPAEGAALILEVGAEVIKPSLPVASVLVSLPLEPPSAPPRDALAKLAALAPKEDLSYDPKIFRLEDALERIPGSLQAFVMDRLQGYFTHVRPL